jgi:hypothetical protein
MHLDWTPEFQTPSIENSNLQTGVNLDILPGVFLEVSETTAIVIQAIRPGELGRVNYQATSWPARCAHNVVLLPDDIVHVTGRDNITLLVEPVANSSINVHSSEIDMREVTTTEIA